MADELNLAAIVGSLRSGSYNRMLLQETARLAPPGMRFTLLEIDDLPLFNEDIEKSDYPESATRLKAGLARSDGLIIATPEYNYGIPGGLKNALDWASRPADDSPLDDLPIALMGASMGMAGTARAQLALRDLFVFTKSPVLPGPEILVASAHEQFDDDGRLTDEDTEAFLRDFLDRFEVFVRRWAREPAY